MPFKIDLDKRPVAMVRPSSLTVTFRDLPGPTLSRVYDFSHNGVDSSQLSDIAAAFYSLHIRSGSASRNNNYSCASRFIEYLATSTFDDGAQEPMYAFMEHLLRQKRPNNTSLGSNNCHMIYGAVASILRRAKMLGDPEWLKCTDVPIQSFKKARPRGSTKRLLSQAEFSAYESAAIAEIEAAQLLPDFRISPRLLFPYFILLTMRCWINVELLRLISRHCIKQDPNPRLDIICWTKQRSHKECSISDTRALYHGPDLIGRVKRLTEALTELVDEGERNLLFLCEYPKPRLGGARNPFGLMTASGLREELYKFVKRHALAPHTFGDLRATAMNNDFQEGRKAYRTSKRANHESLTDTLFYFRSPEGIRSNERIISDAQTRFQGLFLPGVEDPSTSASQTTVLANVNIAQNAQLLGFRCRNPLQGVAPGSKVGEVCPSFFGCFTCPNALFSNEPGAIARLLQLREALLANAQLMPPARWNLLFAPVINILDRDLLPRISPKVTQQAMRLVASLPPLPDMVFIHGE